MICREKPFLSRDDLHYRGDGHPVLLSQFRVICAVIGRITNVYNLFCSKISPTFSQRKLFLASKVFQCARRCVGRVNPRLITDDPRDVGLRNAEHFNQFALTDAVREQCSHLVNLHPCKPRHRVLLPGEAIKAMPTPKHHVSRVFGMSSWNEVIRVNALSAVARVANKCAGLKRSLIRKVCFSMSAKAAHAIGQLPVAIEVKSCRPINTSIRSKLAVRREDAPYAAPLGAMPIGSKTLAAHGAQARRNNDFGFYDCHAPYVSKVAA